MTTREGIRHVQGIAREGAGRMNRPPRFSPASYSRTDECDSIGIARRFDRRSRQEARERASNGGREDGHCFSISASIVYEAWRCFLLSSPLRSSSGAFQEEKNKNISQTRWWGAELASEQLGNTTHFKSNDFVIFPKNACNEVEGIELL